ncbi:MAG TPA: alpha/beta fold hydrolase [Acidisarcina sp.]|nr:alpha/beta fold hydrolase [Acidisarcina sp.]
MRENPGSTTKAGTRHEAQSEGIRHRRSRAWCYANRTLATVLLILLAIGTAFWIHPVWMIDQALSFRLWSAGVRSEYVSVDGHRVHYLIAGQGEPVVLIHGLGSRAEDWANIIPVLASGGYRVYAIDLLGYGRTDKPVDATYSISEEAALVRAFLDAKGLSRVNLGGWSMGGWVALRVASDAPRRVERLMLFDSAGVRFDLRFSPDIFVPDTPEKLADLNAWLMPRPPVLPDFFARDLLRVFHEHRWVIQRSIDSMATGNDLMDGRLSELKMPVLIVWGAEDRLIPVTSGIVMHREIPQSVLAVVDGCGHLAPGQCAGRIGPRVLDFLHSQAPIASRTQFIPAAPGAP